MTRIETTFKELKKAGKKGFIPYVSAGDPSLSATEDIVYRLEDAGADIIELGIPFSEPLADGTTNQLAIDRALKSGTSLSKVLDLTEKIRKRSEIPIVFYSYFNPVYVYGFDKFCKKAEQVGVDGVLLVDLGIIESAPYQQPLKDHHINNINLVTPTTPEARIKNIAKQSSGFVYTVSRAGVTGAQSSVQKDALGLLKRVKKHTTLPVALGFGISKPEHARTYAKICDAVVVGSYIVQTLHDAGKKGRPGAIKEIKKIIDAVKEI